MTVQQKNYVKQHFPTFISASALIFAVTVAYNVVKMNTEMRKDIENNRSKIEKHEIDFSVHMPFEKKIEVFVPRVELDGRIENIEKSLIRIEKKLDK